VDRTAIVLAGGFSTRFGTDKAVLELDGKPLLKHVVDAVSAVVDETIVVVNNQERADIYTKIVGSKAKFALDLKEGNGPLMGALTGFEAAQGKYCLLVGDDTPFVSRDVVELLFELCQGKSAVVPRWPDQKMEPLYSVYHTKTALAAGRMALEDGFFDVRSLIENLGGVRYLSTLVIQEMDPQLKTFFNVNTPIDLKRAEGLLSPKPTKARKR
jgi:molybdopterin-guanine dinucleotide biosynthesis protein A